MREFAPYVALRYNSKMFATRKFAKEQDQGLDAFIAAVVLKLRF